MRRALWTAVTVGLVLAVLSACGSSGDDDTLDQQAAVDSRDSESSTTTSTDSGSDDGLEVGASENGSDLELDSSETASDLERRVSETLSALDTEVRDGDTVIVLPERVLFEFDQDELRPDAAVTLDDLVEVLTFFEEAPVQVDGHTDSAGSDDYNQQLSERRAQAVTDYFVAAGVYSGRITSRGFGESEPVASNDDPEGRAENRRVEIVIEGVDPADLDD